MSDHIDRRGEPRIQADEVYAVELACSGLPFTYKFRIWNLSSKGTCIVVRDDSAVLKEIKVGDVLEMKYYTPETPDLPECLGTEIKHITKDEAGRFKNHTLVGLQIREGTGGGSVEHEIQTDT
jgi:hypothetical protein